jgi:Uri superfamily endonuclease
VESKSEGYRVFGSLGRARLRKGRYVYTGSAMGSGASSLERRLQRHSARSKPIHWHIDYLTCRPGCKVTGAVFVVSNNRYECSVNQAICEEMRLRPVLPRIGASDCNCAGHLLGPERQLSNPGLLKLLTNLYSRLTRGDRSSPPTVQIDCASSHLF